MDDSFTSSLIGLFCGFQVLKMFYLLFKRLQFWQVGFLITPVCGESPNSHVVFICIINQMWTLKSPLD